MDKIYFLLKNIADFFYIFKRIDLPENNNGVKILVFNWRDIHHLWAGGAEVYIHEIVKVWAKNGHTVVLFCGNDGNNPRDEIIDGIRVVRRGGFYMVYLWAILYYIFKFRGKFDIIVDSENGIPFFTPLFSLKPVILLIHHIHQNVFIEQLKFPLSYIGKFVEGKIMPFVYRNCTVVTVSNSSKKDIVNLGMVDEEKIHIINPGINPVPQTYEKTKYPSVIYLGRLKAYKNIDVAIKAFVKVKKRFNKARLLIVGEGDGVENLMALAAKLNISRSIDFLGRVSDDDKNKLLSQSWVSVQPSQVEGWGITVLEANACKTPVVASNTNGLKDSVVDQQTGFLFKVRDSKELSYKIIKIIRSNKLRNQLSENAFEWSKNFHWEISAEKFVQILGSQLGAKKRSYITGKAFANRVSSNI